VAASPPPALGRLPAASRALLLLAALEGTGDLGVLAAAAGRSGVLDGLPPLEQSLLVSVDEPTGRLVFLHPLARDAAVGISTALERRRAHRTLARALADQPDRQAWHLAEATVAPDEHVAARLERTVQASLRRGDAPGAVRALTRAAELSPRGPDRGRRLVEAAHLLMNAECDTDSARRLLVGAVLACGDHDDAGNATLAEARHSLRCAGDWLTGQGDAAPGGAVIALGQETLAAGGSCPAQLTHQELEIATLAASGLTNKQIAERLYLSHRTVSSHLYKLFPKLGINSRVDLRAALASPRPR
jgi:DNA-binding NarL/FixJ family response regulator